MRTAIPDEHFIRVGELVARALGLHYPVERRRDLERAIHGAALELGFADSTAFTDCLLRQAATKMQMETLASHLTVGETYFFRESGHFDFLARQILPGLIQERQNGVRQLRIWCAACCSGEEPYSIAILLRRLIPDVEQWNVTLLATDINPRFLEKAEAGVYGQWSFRDAPGWLKGDAFRERSGGRYEVRPEIKRMVRFSQLNLAEDGYPSLANDTNAMDVIFCRNVLMYFTAEQAQHVIAKLYRCQTERGWLFVGPSELLHVSSSPYSMVKAGGSILYQKDADFARNATVPAQAKVEAIGFSRVKEGDGKKVPAAQILVEAPPPAPRAAEVPVGSEISDQLYAIAGELYEQGRYEDALEKLREISTMLPHAPVLRLMTRCYANQGRLAEALACCDDWISADKLDAPGHYVRAAILQEQHAMEEATRSLRKAVYLDHGFVLAHFALGDIARRRGRMEEAARHFANTRKLLCGRRADEVLAESEGMTAGRLLEMLGSFSGMVEAL